MIDSLAAIIWAHKLYGLILADDTAPKNATIDPRVSRSAVRKESGPPKVTALKKKPLIINPTTSAAQKGNRARRMPVNASAVQSSPTMPRINTPPSAF